MSLRVGLELELLAPLGQTREDLAAALASRAGGRVLYGLKHTVDGELAPGTPRCRLSLACRVLDASGAWLCDVVDDTTIFDELADDGRTQPIVLCDDTRMSKWLEQRSFQADPALEARLSRLLATFDATIEERPARVTDPWGQTLVAIGREPASHARACEIVTRPLQGDRDDVLALVLDATRDHAIPGAAALHAHFDAAPWRNTRALAALLVRFAEDRAAIHARLMPNPRCKKLGPPPADVVRVAREASADTPFSTFAAALKLAGAHKALDLNVLGVIEPFPVQPTLELRCLPMAKDHAAIAASVTAAEALLMEVLG
jgi:Putative amidoligase enzyme